MNTRKILMGAGSVILAVGGFFAGKANYKYTATNVYYKNSVNSCIAVNANSVFTTTGSGTAVSLFTSNGSSPTLYSDASCTNTIASSIYLKS